jgi:hypothetical protein
MDGRSPLTALIGLLVMALGTAQFIIYGFVPPFTMPAELQIWAGLLLFTAAPVLLILGLWLRVGSVLPDRFELHRLFVGAFTVLSLLMAYLIYAGIVPGARMTIIYAALIGTAVGGLVGMAFALVVVYGGYILYAQPSRDGFGPVEDIFHAGGRLTGLYLLAAGIHLITMILGRYSIDSMPVTIALAIIWTLAIVRFRVFTVKAISTFTSEAAVEDAYDTFDPSYSLMTDLWETRGLEVLEETGDTIRLERPNGSVLEMDQTIADEPSIREYRTIDGGVAAHTTLFAFDGDEDGTELTVEMVTERRLSVLDLPRVFMQWMYTVLYLDRHGYTETETSFDVGLGSIEHDF